MYDREINGKAFTFGVSGKLIRNVLVMYDRQTESLWSQLLGEAVQGELIGTKLDFVPSVMMTWAEWKERYPETQALDKGGRRGGRDSYASYYASSSPGVIGETRQDDRLYTKEFVVGVELAEAVKAYPFSALDTAGGVINDTVNGRALVIAFDPQSTASAVYDRTAAGQTLTFEATGTPLILQDAETGSTWDALSGSATGGPLAGEQLQRLKSTRSFWFGWKDIHPNTLLYE